MARVASCPQCEHELLVPDDAEPSALVKCPECRAFFELQHAESRELPAALIVQSHSAPSVPSVELNEPSKLPGLDEFPALASLKGDLEPLAEEALKDESGDADILDFADEEPTADHGSATLQAPRLVDDPQESSRQPGTESHEEAAQRIDQWFRSAKTLSDVPPLEESELAGESSHEMLEPTTHSTGGETIDLTSDKAALADNVSDFKIETPSASPTHASTDDAAPWDDSQHMDRLLADLELQPIDTHEPEAMDHELTAEAHEEQEHFQPASDWTPDESLAIPTAPDQPERKRSIARTLVVSAFGGIIGLGLGYYALLWM